MLLYLLKASANTDIILKLRDPKKEANWTSCNPPRIRKAWVIRQKCAAYTLFAQHETNQQIS
jgi:hypothetical protein